jgi:HEAT repeat protein
LKAFGPGAGEAVPALAAKLAEPRIRPSALAVLTGLGPIAAEATPALIKLLGDKDEAFRRDVIAAIKAIGPGAKAAVPELVKLIKAVDPREYILAIEALGRIGPDAKAAIPQLIEALNENKVGDIEDRIAKRTTIIEALGQIGSASSDVIKALGALLKDNFTPIRVASARSLAMLGPQAKAAVEELKAFGGKTKSPDSESAVWSAIALYKIGVDQNANLQFVVSALKNRAPAGKQARLAAMSGADLLGPAAKQILGELAEALNDNTPLSKYDKTPVRFRAVQAIGKMGPVAKDTVPKLTSILKEPDPMKSAVLEALGQIGPAAAFAAARLREIIRTDPSFAEKAQEVLDLIEKP